MILFEMMLKTVLRENDPVQDIDAKRLARVREKIMMQARYQAQMKPELHKPIRWRVQWPTLDLMPTMKLALGSGLLILGLWVGQHINTTQTQVIAQHRVDQKISVMAMASPWEGWIEGGE